MSLSIWAILAYSVPCLGAKDLLVLPELNALVGVWPQHLAVEADVRDMPGVWVSADHQVAQCFQTVMRHLSPTAFSMSLYRSMLFAFKNILAVAGG